MKEGIVLFAHGSREREWARPFEALAATVSRKFAGPVRLAYLELMQPTLETAVDALVAEGASSVRVVPVFFGRGGHVADDLPKLAAAIGKKHPRLKIQLEAAIGEQPAVIEAIAAAITSRSGVRASR